MPLDSAHSVVKSHDRTSGIGGSDAAAALGLSQWKTQYQLWREKKGLTVEKDISDKPYIEWGTLLEDVVAQKFAQTAMLKVQRVNGQLRSPDYPWMTAHVDRAIVNRDMARAVRWNGKRLNTDAILEVKTASSFASGDEWGDEGTDQIPLYYATQAVHYLIVTGCEIVHFGVLLDGNKFRRYRITRDPKLIEMVVDGEREFWRMVEQDIEPPITTLDDVKLKYSNGVEEQSIEATPDIANTLSLLQFEQQKYKASEEAIKQHKLKLMSFMGEATVLTMKGVPVVTWKKPKDSRKFDSDRFEREQAQLFEQYQHSVGNSRRFLVK